MRARVKILKRADRTYTGANHRSKASFFLNGTSSRESCSLKVRELSAPDLPISRIKLRAKLNQIQPLYSPVLWKIHASSQT